MPRGLIGTVVHLLGNKTYIAIAVVTLLTLSVVGAVLVTTTSVGCSPANWLGVKTTRCTTQPVANRASPTPSPTSQSYPFQPVASAPFTPSPSDNPPYNPGASNYPPYNPGNSGVPAYTGPSSGSYPPMPYPGSASTPPGVALSCRLPVYAAGPGSGGFVVFPGVTFVADPRSAVTAPSPSPGTATPAPPGYGYNGWWGLTYDATYSKWLPVPRNWVSPDGAHYAYPLSGDIYVQSLTGGSQLELGAGRNYSPLKVENAGVYVVTPNQAGLWYLPFSGAAQQVTTAGFWQAEAGGAAYGTPTSAVPQGATNTIMKLDVKTGATLDYFSLQGGQAVVTGFDGQNHPVVQVNFSGGIGLYIVTAPNTSTIIAGTYGYSQYFPYGMPVADSHGLWFSQSQGIVLFSGGAWYWMSYIGGNLAGACA